MRNLDFIDDLITLYDHLIAKWFILELRQSSKIGAFSQTLGIKQITWTAQEIRFRLLQYSVRERKKQTIMYRGYWHIQFKHKCWIEALQCIFLQCACIFVIYHSEFREDEWSDVWWWLTKSKLIPSFFALVNDKFSSFFHRSSLSRSRFRSLKTKVRL